ncbi:hypothetical protein PS2_118 [Serratia phage PS2]|uniref:Uncharacterized protein n=1 Tax=Serratia phage PS2 TaxID=1481112 RepID=A0A023W4V4_9CAUD|nr:hypothetical protein FF83_gp118 [Serratia phage PS2]AHY25364.1 hypothetical protein PS2_118 [Serratia phage PS2]
MKVEFISWDELTETTPAGFYNGDLNVTRPGVPSIYRPNPFPKSNIALMGGRRAGKDFFYIDYEHSTIGDISRINPQRFSRKGKFTEADAFIGIKEHHPDVCYNEKFKQVLLKCRSQK